MKLAALSVFCVLLFTGCDSLRGISDIEYTATGVNVSRVSLTYEASGGGTEQIASRALPWSYAFKGKKDDFLYVSAQIIEGEGTVTVTIKKSGQIFKSATSTGFASIATASGLLDLAK